MEDIKKPTTVGGVPTGDMTDSGNPTHNPDGTFGSRENMSSKFNFDEADDFDFLNNLDLDGSEEFDFLDDIDLKEDIDSNVPRDYNSSIAKGVGREHYEKIHDIIDNCDNVNIKKIFKKYENLINYEHSTKRAHQYFDTIYLNIEQDSKGSSYQKPYEIFFHEIGHGFDFKNRYNSNNLKTIRRNMSCFSSSYKDGLFPNTIKQEVKEMVDKVDKEFKMEFKVNKNNYQWLLKNGFISSWKYGYLEKSNFVPDFLGIKYSKEYAYEKIKKELKQIPLMERANFSDMLEGATYCKLKLGVGHSTNYYRKGNNNGINESLATEAFTEMMASVLVNNESLQTIKKYLPKSYSVFEEMLEALAK